MTMNTSHLIIENLANICVAQKLQVTTAESCTGGLAAKLITDRDGSSQWSERGFITYSNLAKEQMIGVAADLIKQWGAVSEPVASAMAEGALIHSMAHYSLAITGIAGPQGGTKEKPVGTVCFAWAYKDKKTKQYDSSALTKLFVGDREQIRQQAADFSLQELYQIIVNNQR